MANTSAESWLTKEAFDRLSGELEHLTGEARIDIAHKIELAREEGDLKENGGYHAAKDEQGKIEARIRQLTTLLRHAKVGTPPDDGIVEPGMVVSAKIGGEKSRFLIGNREIGGDSDLDVYSEHSPLGAAILGRKEGDTVSYTAPNGKSITVELLKVTSYSL